MLTESLYAGIVKYASYRHYSIRGSFNNSDSTDIAHDVIVDKEFTDQNWMSLVDRYIYKRVAEFKKIKYIPNYDITPANREAEEKLFCKNCQEFYPRSIFGASHSFCGICYYKLNKERLLLNQKKHKAANREKYTSYSRLYYRRNKELCNRQSKKYKENNKEKIKEYSKKYYEENKEKIKEYRLSDRGRDCQKRYREENRDKIRKRSIEYRQKNKDKRVAYDKNQRKTKR